MKSARLALTDPDLARALPALKRAAAAAWRLALETDTPFYVLENGRIVDRNAARRRRGAKRPAGTAARRVGVPRTRPKSSK